jgi:hypothetical protein
MSKDIDETDKNVRLLNSVLPNTTYLTASVACQALGSREDGIRQHVV